MTIETICDACIKAIKDAGYNESTLFNYKGVVRRFKKFCIERGVIEYSCDIGKQYANDNISKKTGKFSKNRFHTQGRFVRLIDSYFNTGIFDFSMFKRGKISPDNPQHKTIYEDYQKYLHSIYDNENTIHFYEYGMYCVLQFLGNLGIYDLCDLQSHMVIKYIKETKQSRQREVLCELRGIFRYLERKDLLSAIAGIHAPRIKRIIPILSDEENQKIESVIAGDRSWISPIREFGRYLQSIGYENAYVLDNRFTIRRYHAEVYLMTESEIQSFFKECDRFVLRHKALGRPYVLPALYRFLYCCGARCAEARKLKCEDVKLDKGYVDTSIKGSQRLQVVFVR